MNSPPWPRQSLEPEETNRAQAEEYVNCSGDDLWTKAPRFFAEEDPKKSGRYIAAEVGKPYRNYALT